MNRDTLSPRRAGGVQPTTPMWAYDHGESPRGVGCMLGPEVRGGAPRREGKSCHDKDSLCGG